MNATVDTNVLLRALVRDDQRQAQVAIAAIEACEVVVIER